MKHDSMYICLSFQFWEENPLLLINYIIVYGYNVQNKKIVGASAVFSLMMENNYFILL